MKTTYAALCAFIQYPKYFRISFSPDLRERTDDLLELDASKSGAGISYQINCNGCRINAGFLEEHQTAYGFEIKREPAFETIVCNHGLVSFLK